MEDRYFSSQRLKGYLMNKVNDPMFDIEDKLASDLSDEITRELDKEIESEIGKIAYRINVVVAWEEQGIRWMLDGDASWKVCEEP